VAPRACALSCARVLVRVNPTYKSGIGVANLVERPTHKSIRVNPERTYLKSAYVYMYVKIRRGGEPENGPFEWGRYGCM